MYIFWFRYLYFLLDIILWFPISWLAQLQGAKNTWKCNCFSMALGEVLLRSTLITMAPSVFQKTNFKGYFSQSQTSKCLMRFFGSETGPWAQISWEGTIFHVEHDDRKIFPIFENFGKYRNKVWVPPIMVDRFQVEVRNTRTVDTSSRFNNCTWKQLRKFRNSGKILKYQNVVLKIFNLEKLERP